MIQLSLLIFNIAIFYSTFPTKRLPARGSLSYKKKGIRFFFMIDKAVKKKDIIKNVFNTSIKGLTSSSRVKSLSFQNFIIHGMLIFLFEVSKDLGNTFSKFIFIHQ